MGTLRHPESEFYDVTDGFWFGPGKACIYIADDGVADELVEQASAFALQPFAQTLLESHPTLDEWVESHPLPDEDDDPPGDDEAVELWWRGFGQQLLKCGWHLLWRAELYTTVEEVSRLPELIAAFPDEVERLAWPADCEIEVNQLRERNTATSTFAWSAVLGCLP